MGRIIGIDYGAKRVGVAVTDPLQIIASALETVSTDKILVFLKNYCKSEVVESFVIGMPKNLDGNDTDGTKYVENFVQILKLEFPDMPIFFCDERYTSKMAMQTLVAGGMKKKDRQIKSNLDKVSAAIILQSFMASKT